MTLEDAFYDMAHKSTQPLKVLDADMAMSVSSLTRACLPRDSETWASFPSHKISLFTRLTNKFIALDVIEQSLGRIGVLLPPLGRASAAHMAHLSIKTIGEFGELLKEIEHATADRKITSAERERIQREGYQAIQSILQLMAACEVKL